MKQNKKYNNLFKAVVLIFIIFFISVNAIENYYTNQKTILFVNGVENFTENEKRKINVDSILYGIWDDENHMYDTNHKYILMKMKTQKVILSTNRIEDVIDYVNK